MSGFSILCDLCQPGLCRSSRLRDLSAPESVLHLVESHGTLTHLLISVILFVGCFRSCFNGTSPYKFHTSLIYLVARAQIRRYVVIITSISLQNAGYGSDTAGVSSWDQRASDRRYAASEFRTRVRGQGEYYLRMFMCLRL